MNCKKHISRYTRENSTSEGWRLSITKSGVTFRRYFSDKRFEGGRKSLAAAEKALKELKAIFDGSKLVDGKLSPSTIKKAQKFLKDAG